MSIYADIQSNVEMYLKANFTGYTICWDNIKFDPPSNVPWVRPTFLFAESFREEMTGLANTGQKFSGILDIQVFVPIGSATHLVYKIGDTLLALFNETIISGVVFFVPYLNRIGETPDDAGFQINVSCPFEYLT